MTSEFTLQRHQKLWEEQNVFIKRLVVGVPVVGLLILLKVSIPFVQDTRESAASKEDVAAISREMAPLEQRRTRLQELSTAMSDVKKTIRNAPWTRERNELIENLARIRRESPDGGTREEYQQAADNAIAGIFSQVDGKVIRPLEESLPAGRESSGLATGITTLRTDMVQWKNEQMGKVWYRTVHEKDEKIRELDRSLRRNLAKTTPVLKAAQDRIKADLRALHDRMKDLNEDIRRREQHLQQLERDMEQILPEWISGLIDVKQMIQLFPLLFPVAAIYMVVIALRLTAHYRFIVRETPLSPRDVQDFSASSIFTLSRRGFPGTPLTLALYLAVIGIFLALFEQGVDMLTAWLATQPEDAWLDGGKDIATLLWTGRVVHIAVIGMVFLRLHSDRPWGMRSSGPAKGESGGLPFATGS